MNPSIPKIVLDALARYSAQAAGTHPAADTLNAYAEGNLSANESTQLAGHLAGCPECRQVLFLANSASERDAAVAAAKPYSERVRLVSWWRWMMPVAAVAAIAIAFVAVKRTEQPSPANQEARVIQADNYSAPAPATKSSGHSAGQQRAKSSAAAGTKAAHLGDRLSSPATARTIATAPARPKAVDAAAPSPNLIAEEVKPRAMAANANLATTPPANVLSSGQPMIAANGPSQRQQQQTTLAVSGPPIELAPQTAPGASPAPAASNKTADTMAFANATGGDIVVKRSALSRMASQLWRISSDGHVERLIQNQWHRALNGVQKSFRVVAYLQDHVWAGGNGPELFHSADGGENWQTIKVKSGETEFNGSMQTIKASDAQHLAIIADDGSTWITTDGGQTWTKQ